MSISCGRLGRCSLGPFGFANFLLVLACFKEFHFSGCIVARLKLYRPLTHRRCRLCGNLCTFVAILTLGFVGTVCSGCYCNLGR